MDKVQLDGRFTEGFRNFKLIPAFECPAFFMTDFGKNQWIVVFGGQAQRAVFELIGRSAWSVGGKGDNIAVLQGFLHGLFDCGTPF